MHARFLLGPAGSGKTFRCLAEIRAELARSPEGHPLILLAPKQATFQLERQLLADGSLTGYTRLQIVSFDRLAEFTLGEFAASLPRLLDDEGRVMALRALLGRHQSALNTFHATARLPGFAQQLSLLLRELQRHQFSDERLALLAEKFRAQPVLAGKLHDLALLLRSYLDWLRAQDLQDADCLPDIAVAELRKALQLPTPNSQLKISGLWLDGFAEMTPQEMDLLAAFLPVCERATLAFCLDGEPARDLPWLSPWSVVGRTFRDCHQRVSALPDCKVEVEILNRKAAVGRFANNAALRHLEECWSNPVSSAPGFSPVTDTLTAPAVLTASARGKTAGAVGDSSHDLDTGLKPGADESGRSAIRALVCSDPETESVLAAREILQHVRAGGRYRECAVIVRSLEPYHGVLTRVFHRYDIPFFLDRREPVAHHPLAELTRSALRLAAFGWPHDDWFGALKTGLATDDEAAVDRLENEALARGWQGSAWFRPLKIPDDVALEKSMNRCLEKMLPPFARWNEALAALQRRPTGSQLAAALRDLWRSLNVGAALEKWSAAAPQSAVHATVFDAMDKWLTNVELAFGDTAMPLAEWLPILEAGLANLSVGVIPPALDQVAIGAIDRARSPELKLALVPGLNEGVFPAPPAAATLLTDSERDALAGQKVLLGPGRHQQIGRERFYGYIACTRASERLVLTCAVQNAGGQPLNPSPFFAHVRQLTGVAEEKFQAAPWWESEHLNEIAAPLLKMPAGAESFHFPALLPLVEKHRQIQQAAACQKLAAPVVEKIFGRGLKTSVSGLEQFAACPFKFFAARGLRLEERKEFEFDDRDKGGFHHDVLQKFHERVAASGRRWRDLGAIEAATLIEQIGREELPEFGGGKFLADGAARFAGEVMIERLKRLVVALIGWMPQYGFDPVAVEVGFDDEKGELPSWRLDLGDGRVLLLRGRVDRVDLCRLTGDTVLAVVMDYKSSPRSLNKTKLHHGLELQLLSYLGVLKNLHSPEKVFGAKQLQPAGVFFIPLNGGGGKMASQRDHVLSGGDSARRAAYQHSGRFLADELKHFDNRGLGKGDQFKFKTNQDGSFSKAGSEAMPAADFDALRGQIEKHLRDYGRRIFSGEIGVSPFRIGRETACDYCEFRPVCRFDPWTQPFRQLRPPPKPSQAGAAKTKKGKPA